MNSKTKTPAATNYIGDELARLRMAGTEVQRIRLYAQRELNLARQMRAEAERYLKETETKARSQAQILILKTRLETRKELAEVKRRTNEELQKVLVDIRMVRIMAQEELEVQRKIIIRIMAQEKLEVQQKITDADRDVDRIKNLSITSRKKFKEKTKKVAETVSV